MTLRKLLYCISILSAAIGLSSCSHDNPTFGELGGTRWNGTNIGTGMLIDIQFGPIGTDDVSLTFYKDSTPYEERGIKIDTAGNRQNYRKGRYVPKMTTTDKGDELIGYEWYIYFDDQKISDPEGYFSYDNRMMIMRLDGACYPMTQIL